MLLLAPLLLSLVQEPVTAPAAPEARPVTRVEDPASRRANAVSMSFAGMESLFVDPRDQGLLDFLLGTVDRLPEFAATGGWDAELPVDQIQLVARLMMAPWDLAIDHDPNAMPVPVSGHLHLHAESADALPEDEALILEFLREIGIEIGEPEVARDGLRPVLAEDALGGFDVRLGSRTSSGNGSFVLSVNEAGSEQTADLVPFLPSNVQHAFSMHVNASSLMDMFDFTCNSPMVPPILRGMCDLAAQLEVNYSIGHGEEVSQSTLRLRSFIPLMRDLELLDEQALAIEDLSLIPRDATDAAILQVNPKGVLVLIRRIAQAAGEDDPFGKLLEEEGVDLPEMIAALGSNFGYYNVRREAQDENDFVDIMGLRTAVFFAEVRDEEVIREATAELQEQLAEKDPGEDPFALHPVFRFENGYLFVGFDEGAADRAAAQARDRANSLLSRPELLEALGRDDLSLMMLQWQDTPKLADLGYDTIREFAEMAAGFMDQMAIDMRVDRIFPSKEELFRNARPKITTVRREIDDLSAYSVGDRSILLHLCAMAGSNGFAQALLAMSDSAGRMGSGAETWEENEIEASIPRAPEEFEER